MKKFLKRFWQEEEGMETIEVVVIIAVLLTIALIFRKTIVKFVTNLTGKLFTGEEDLTNTEYTPPTEGE
jgi:Flp pilus assembly pilin Flp